MRSLPDIFKLFVYKPTGDTNYYYSPNDYYSPNVLIADDALFAEVEFDSVKFDQTRNSTSLGTSYTKKFDFEFGDISQAIDLDNSVLLFTDTNGNSWLTGHEKPYSLNTSSKSIDDKSNTIEITLEQTSYNELEPVTKFWFDNATSIDFPRGGDYNVVSGFTGVTGGSIILSWFPKSYTVDYKGFSLVRTNPQGHSSGLTTNISINDINATGYTDTPDYYFGGTYKYKIALAQNLNGVNPYQYSNEISIDTVNPNIPLSLTGTITGNSINLTWNNPVGGYKIPYSGFIIFRTNPSPLHASGATNQFFVASGSTSYTDHNVGQTGEYKYKIAISGDSGVNQYSNEASFDFININIPSGLTATTSGNSIILNWNNPAGGYTYTVQSFAVNRCEVVDGNKTNCVVLTFNNDGSATEYIDSNIGLSAPTGKTFAYQIATAKLPDGFERQEFSDFSNDEYIINVSEPPNIGLTGSYTLHKYYGSYEVTDLELQVSGGSGAVNVKWYDSIYSTSRNQTQLVNLSGGTTPFTVILTATTSITGAEGKLLAARGGDTWNIDLSGTSDYNIVSNTPLSIPIPVKPVFGSSLTGSQVGADVHLSWDQFNDTGATTIYGYRVVRYVSDFSSFVEFYVAGNSTVTFTDVAPSPASYHYYVLANSINGVSVNYYNSSASNQFDITVT